MLPTPRHAKVVDPQLPPLTARRVGYLVVQPEENRDLQEQILLEQIVAEHEELATAVELANGFYNCCEHEKRMDLRGG